VQEYLRQRATEPQPDLQEHSPPGFVDRVGGCIEHCLDKMGDAIVMPIEKISKALSAPHKSRRG
jgi:hypothetical protein